MSQLVQLEMFPNEETPAKQPRKSKAKSPRKKRVATSTPPEAPLNPPTPPPTNGGGNGGELTSGAEARTDGTTPSKVDEALAKARAKHEADRPFVLRPPTQDDYLRERAVIMVKDVTGVERAMFTATDVTPLVYEVRLTTRPSTFGDVLVMVKAVDEVDCHVAFHTGLNVLDALQGAGRRLANGSMSFTPDEWPGKTGRELLTKFKRGEPVPRRKT